MGELHFSSAPRGCQLQNLICALCIHLTARQSKGFRAARETVLINICKWPSKTSLSPGFIPCLGYQVEGRIRCDWSPLNKAWLGSLWRCLSRWDGHLPPVQPDPSARRGQAGLHLIPRGCRAEASQEDTDRICGDNEMALLLQSWAASVSSLILHSWFCLCWHLFAAYTN